MDGKTLSWQTLKNIDNYLFINTIFLNIEILLLLLFLHSNNISYNRLFFVYMLNVKNPMQFCRIVFLHLNKAKRGGGSVVDQGYAVLVLR